MKKHAFSICENKAADQVRSNCTADKGLCFGYIDSTIPLLPKPEFQASSCTARFVSDLVQKRQSDFLTTQLI